MQWVWPSYLPTMISCQSLTHKRWAPCSWLQVSTLLCALCLVIRGKPQLCLNTISMSHEMPQGAGSCTPRPVTSLPAPSDGDSDNTTVPAAWDHFCTDHFLYRIIFKGLQANFFFLLCFHQQQRREGFQGTASVTKHNSSSLWECNCF